jgi:hypothetical protein
MNPVFIEKNVTIPARIPGGKLGAFSQAFDRMAHGDSFVLDDKKSLSSAAQAFYNWRKRTNNTECRLTVRKQDGGKFRVWLVREAAVRKAA